MSKSWHVETASNLSTQCPLFSVAPNVAQNVSAISHEEQLVRDIF